MPEGPEVHRAADKVAEAIAGRVVEELFFQPDELKSNEQLLAGQTVTIVEARGKVLLIYLDNGYVIYTNNQLHGKWTVRKSRDIPETKRKLQLALHSTKKSILLYSAPDIEVLPTNDLANHALLSKLGPDPIDDAVTVEEVIDLLMHKQYYRRKLTSLLLDQQFLAGIGIYLRSEILFVGQVHPSYHPMDCSPKQIRRLALASIVLPRQAYQTEGITNNLQIVERLKKQGVERANYRFWVFNREGKPCYLCDTAIVKEEIGGRRIYYCPNCQKE